MAGLDKVTANLKKEEPTEPWRPVQLLDADPVPGYRLRWRTKEKVEGAIAEGWEVVKQSEVGKLTMKSTIIDGSQMNADVTKRNLILMKMPESRAKSRDAYFSRETDALLPRATEEFKKNAGGPGETYGIGIVDDEVK